MLNVIEGLIEFDSECILIASDDFAGYLDLLFCERVFKAQDYLLSHGKGAVRLDIEAPGTEVHDHPLGKTVVVRIYDIGMAIFSRVSPAVFFPFLNCPKEFFLIGIG